MARTTVAISGRVFPNGRVDPAALVNTGTPNGALLERSAAASWARLRAAVAAQPGGWWPQITSTMDGYRPYSVQERIFLERYRRTYAVAPGGRVDRRIWNGVPYWRWRNAAAAIPGTSNHGAADTVDVADIGGYSGARWKAFARVAPDHGWDNAEGRSVNEPWHWRYYPARDRYAHLTAPAATIPTAPQEDDMSAHAEAQIAEIHNFTAHIIALLAQHPAAVAQAIMATPVSRVAGAPSTFLQDTVDGTTAAMRAAALLDPDGNGALDFPDVEVEVDAPQVDPEALATALAPLLTAEGLRAISDADVARIAQAAADERDRRERARLG